MKPTIVMLDKQEIDIEKLDRDELVELKASVDARIGAIKDQLHSARVNASVHGVYADQTWYRNAMYAQSAYQRASQAIQIRLGKMKKTRGDDSNSVANLFVDLARQRLDEDFFDELLDEAKYLSEQRRIAP